MHPFHHVETRLDSPGSPGDMLGDIVARAHVSAEHGRVDHRVETDGVPAEEDLQAFWGGEVDAHCDGFVHLCQGPSHV